MAPRIDRLMLAAAVTFSVACGGRPTPCSSADACAAGVCHAGRCGAVDAVPVTGESRREVVRPDLSRAAGATFAVTVDDRDTALLVRFPRTWGTTEPERAFVVFTATTDAASPITFEIARVVEPWTLTSSPPRVGPIEVTATLVPTPDHPVRIDVTDAVREWTRTGDKHHGFAIRTRNRAATIALDSGDGPTLDLYFPAKSTSAAR